MRNKQDNHAIPKKSNCTSGLQRRIRARSAQISISVKIHISVSPRGGLLLSRGQETGCSYVPLKLPLTLSFVHDTAKVLSEEEFVSLFHIAHL